MDHVVSEPKAVSKNWGTAEESRGLWFAFATMLGFIALIPWIGFLVSGMPAIIF